MKVVTQSQERVERCVEALKRAADEYVDKQRKLAECLERQKYATEEYEAAQTSLSLAKTALVDAIVGADIRWAAK